MTLYKDDLPTLLIDIGRGVPIAYHVFIPDDDCVRTKILDMNDTTLRHATAKGNLEVTVTNDDGSVLKVANVTFSHPTTLNQPFASVRTLCQV